MDNPSDLLVRAKGGDRQALESLLSTLAPSILRFGTRMCRGGHDAEDVLQDTLLTIANHLGEFKGESSLESWVFALTRSACARRTRGLKNKPPLSDEYLVSERDAAPSPEERAAERELSRVLHAALDGLSDEHREVIHLRDVEGLTAPEAAHALGISVDALKSRLHRAREALRVNLRPVLEPNIQSPPNCPDVVALWSKKLEGDLRQSDCERMENHLATCASCGAACSALKEALSACTRARSETVPPWVEDRVRRAVLAWTGPR